MALHPPSAPSTPKVEQPSAATPPPQSGPRKKSPGFFDWLKQYWERVTEGLEISQLWKQFKADAEVSFRFYRKDFDARSPHEQRGKNILHTIQEFTWALLEKLSPARRVLLLLGVVILFFGGLGFNYTDKEGAVHGISIDLHFYGGLILLVVLMLEVADRVVMKRDLEIARDIQSWLLPTRPPQIPGLEMAFATRPANTVAGDYYDVFARTPGSNETQFLLAIADVAGKSIPAALLMATFQASLKTLSATQCSLSTLVVNLNQYACTNSQGGLRFTTAFIAEFDPTTRVLNYINAGHNTPILKRARGEVERLTNGGLPLGIMAESAYETGSLVLQPGDWLIIFTDGLVEAENSASGEYGESRLLTVLDSNDIKSPQDLLHSIMADLDAFVGTAPQHDDVTCILIKVVS
jgi:sigma-B regulation protein RsbU (phosphoserine phosphatase)